MPTAHAAPTPDPTNPQQRARLPVRATFTHQEWRGSVYAGFGMERMAGTIPQLDTKTINLVAAHFSSCLAYDTFEGDYSPGAHNPYGPLHAHVPPTAGYGITPASVNRAIDFLCAAGYLHTVRERRRGMPGRYRMTMPRDGRPDVPKVNETAARFGLRPDRKSRDTTKAAATRRAKSLLRREGADTGSDDPIVSVENPVDEDHPSPSPRSTPQDRHDDEPQHRRDGDGQHRHDGDRSPYRDVGKGESGDCRWAGTGPGRPDRRSGVRPIGRMPLPRRPYDDALLRWRDEPTA